MKKETLFIVNDSGEILQELGTDYDRLVNNTIVIKPRVAERELNRINPYPYVKINTGLPIDFYKDYPQVFLLLPFIEYNTNFLTFSNGRYVNQTNFAKATGYSRIFANRLFNKYKKDQIIAQVKSGRRTVYMFNPYIAMMGCYIYKDLLDNFKDNKWEKLTRRKEIRYEI